MLSIFFTSLFFLLTPIDPAEYHAYITGTFTSTAQAQGDPTHTFDDVTIDTYKLFTDSIGGTWFYTQQYETKHPTHPYRQRLYYIIPQGNLLKQFIYLYPTGTYKAGCDITIRKLAPATYYGITHATSCTATFRNSTYTTAAFLVTPAGIISWERGYTNTHQQIWGSIIGPYHFQKRSIP